MTHPVLSLILPVHNEADIIKPVYAEIRRMLKTLGVSYETIMVENGSSDASLSVIRSISKRDPHVRVLVAPKGYGSAVLTGLRASRGTYVSYMPSDGQIDLAVFPDLFSTVTSGSADIAKIRRITRETPIRSLVSRTFSLFTRILFVLPRMDINGSPRIFRRTLVPKLALSYTDSFIDTEFAVRAHALGMTFREFPMRTLPRLGGSSTRSWRTFAEFFRNLIVFRLKTIV